MLVFALLCISLCPFQFCKHLGVNERERERACSCALIVFLMSLTVDVLCLFLTVPLIGLRCVIVVFPDHTHLP